MNEPEGQRGSASQARSTSKRSGPSDQRARLEKAYHRLGTRTPRCTVAGCDETDVDALTGTFPDIICYQHLAKKRGRKLTEGDHLAGQHNVPTPIIEIPANDHRVKSALMNEWPDETVCNPDGSPLLKIAATIRGWVDVLRVILERGVGRIPEALERLDACLTRVWGAFWWKNPDLGWDVA